MTTRPKGRALELEAKIDGRSPNGNSSSGG